MPTFIFALFRFMKKICFHNLNTLMPYPCSPFYADIKFVIRFDNRFDIRLWNSFLVKLYDISTKLTTWIGH